MKNCDNCKHLFQNGMRYFCNIGGMEIDFPILMGGPKKCECYENQAEEKRKFEYPKKRL